MTKKRPCTQSGFAKKELLNKNPAKKTQTYKKSNFDRHPMIRFYKKHNLASKSLLFNKETQVEIFFESVFGKSKCDCQRAEELLLKHEGDELVLLLLFRLRISTFIEFSPLR
jgi:hypothetical protein